MNSYGNPNTENQDSRQYTSNSFDVYIVSFYEIHSAMVQVPHYTKSNNVIVNENDINNLFIWHPSSIHDLSTDLPLKTYIHNDNCFNFCYYKITINFDFDTAGMTANKETDTPIQVIFLINSCKYTKLISNSNTVNQMTDGTAPTTPLNVTVYVNALG